MNNNRLKYLPLLFISFSFILLGCVPSYSQSNVKLTPWGESYDQPIAMVPWINDDFILIEKDGKVKTIDQAGKQLAVVLDVKDHIADTGGERGLLGVALHPSYPDSPYIYLNHTDKSNNTAIVRYVFHPKSSTIDPSTRGALYSDRTDTCILGWVMVVLVAIRRTALKI